MDRDLFKPGRAHWKELSLPAAPWSSGGLAPGDGAGGLAANRHRTIDTRRLQHATAPFMYNGGRSSVGSASEFKSEDPRFDPLVGQDEG